MWRFVLLWGLDPCISHSVISPWLCILPPQDQLSADMYSFVAKEIDYANYFQTVRVHEGETAYSPFARVLVQTGRSVGVRLRPRDWACDGKERDVTVLPVKKPCLFFLLVWIPLPPPPENPKNNLIHEGHCNSEAYAMAPRPGWFCCLLQETFGNGWGHF